MNEESALKREVLSALEESRPYLPKGGAALGCVDLVDPTLANIKIETEEGFIVVRVQFSSGYSIVEPEELATKTADTSFDSLQGVLMAVSPDYKRRFSSAVLEKLGGEPS